MFSEKTSKPSYFIEKKAYYTHAILNKSKGEDPGKNNELERDHNGTHQTAYYDDMHHTFVHRADHREKAKATSK